MNRSLVCVKNAILCCCKQKQTCEFELGAISADIEDNIKMSHQNSENYVGINYMYSLGNDWHTATSETINMVLQIHLTMTICHI